MSPKFKGRNFSDQEKQLLLRLTECESYILECKNIQANALQEKRETWEKIAKLFNAEKSVVAIPRSVDEIRKCWMNQKYKVKQSLAKELQTSSMHFGSNTSPTLMNVDVDPALINQSPEPVQNSWEGDLVTKNGHQPGLRNQPFESETPGSQILERESSGLLATSTTSLTASSQEFPEPLRAPSINNIPNSMDYDSASSGDAVWPVSLRPYQKRKLDAILDQDQKITSSQLVLSRLEEERNKLQLKILNEQLKNVQKEADLLDRKILLTDREIILTDRKIQYWDRIFKTGGGHHHMFPNM